MPAETINEDKDRRSESLDVPEPHNPEPDPPDTPTWRAVKKGAKWGSIVGFAIAQLIMSSRSIQTPFGPIYGENLFALFAFWIGLGCALGAGIGWAYTDSHDSEPPPT
jgi:hypothetical protein